MKETQVQKIMEGARALLTGHFKLSSGRHSGRYIQCAQVLQYPDKADRLGKALGEKCKKAFGKIDVVASPAVGGLVMGQETARALKVRAIFAERDGSTGELVFRRGFYVKKGEKVLLVDDVLTTGGSLRETAELVRSQGGVIVGAAALAERGLRDKGFINPQTLIKVSFDDYDGEECPFCKQGSPLTKPGSRPEVPEI